MDSQHPDITPLCALSDAERTRALERYGILQPCVEHAVPLTRVAHQQGLPLRTVQRWLVQYRRAGLAGLARRGRSDRGRQRRLRAELKPIIEGFALRTPPPTVALVHRQVCAVALEHGWPVPTYQSVYRVMKHLDPALLTLAHAGTKAYRTTFDLLYRRNAGAPNEMWQADHTLLDLWVQQDSGAPARPWLTVIMDDYSRAIAGFGVSLHAPSAIQTALVLRQAIWRKPLPQWHICGIPATFYTDHGRDFTSQHLEQVSAELKMGLVFSEAGMPRGRGRMAEIRVFHQHRFLCRAICPELAGDTIALREIIQARNHRRKALRHTLQDRARTVDALLEAHRGHHPADEPPLINDPAVTQEKDTAREEPPKLKRYHNADIEQVLREKKPFILH